MCTATGASWNLANGKRDGGLIVPIAGRQPKSCALACWSWTYVVPAVGFGSIAMNSNARKSAPKAYPLCPICHESMNLTQYQKVSGVVVHRCLTCGVWLDGANAAKFFFLFEAGRMAEFEKRAARADTEELKARIAKLEKQQSLPSPSCSMSEPDVTYTHRSGIFPLFDVLGFLGSLWDD